MDKLLNLLVCAKEVILGGETSINETKKVKLKFIFTENIQDMSSFLIPFFIAVI